MVGTLALPTLRSYDVRSTEQQLESRQKLLLGPGCGPRRQIIAHRGLGQVGVPAEQALRLSLRKARQMCGCEMGRAATGGPDGLGGFIGADRRQAAASMEP